MDFDPAEGGQVGQIIEFSHEIGPTAVLANSFGEWLHELAEGLESGKFVYYPEEETVAPLGLYEEIE